MRQQSGDQLAAAYWQKIADEERKKNRQLMARLRELVAENERLRTELQAWKDGNR